MSTKSGEQTAFSAPRAASSNDYRPPSRLSKLASHVKRFWWMHLISFILGTVPFLITLFVISIPM
jgi:hypothetical protein